MPIYEYKCNDCSKEFEKIVLNKQSTFKCPCCNSENYSRKPSLFGFRSSKGFTSSKSTPSCQSCSSTNCQSCGK